MKSSKRNKLLGLALTGSFSLFGASNALAAAGDTISNFATLQYSVGTTPQTVIESGSGAGNSVPGVGYAVANSLTTDFLEDRVINFTVVRENGAAVAVAPGSAQQVIPYLIDNTGNDTHGFLLAAIHNSGALDPFGGVADDFTPTTIQTYVDTDGNGVLDPAEIAATNTYIPSFAPGAGTATGGSSTGAEIRVFVVSDIPLVDDSSNPLATDDIAVMSLVAQAADDATDGTPGTAITNDDNGNVSPGGTFTNGTAVVVAGTPVINVDDPANVETVFNDGAFNDGVTGPTVDGTGVANDTVQNAQHSSYSSYTILTAALTVAKSVTTLYDPVNLETLPKAIPGATVRYTITITNAAGAAAATLTNITDVLNDALMEGQLSDGGAGNAIIPGSAGNNVRIIDGAGTTTYCLADGAAADGCTYAGALGDTVTVDLGIAAGTATLNATESLTVDFNVIVQ
jgi:hypothetical protein